MPDEPIDAIEALLPSYALNALDEEETLIVERALAEEPRYRALLEEHLESLSVLARSHAPAIPRASVREGLMSRVHGVSSEPEPASERAAARSGRGVPRAFWGIAAALVVAVVGMGAFSTVQQQRVAELQDEVGVVSAEAKDARSELMSFTEMVARPGATTKQLRADQRGIARAMGQGRPSGPAAVVVTTPDGERMLVVVNLGGLDPGYMYKAWWKDDKQHAWSAAEFRVDANGYARVRLHGAPSGIRSLTVSLEPENGSDSPSAELVLNGELDGTDGASPGVFNASDEVFGQNQEGDNRVIASIGSTEMTYGSIRRTTEAAMAADASLGVEDAEATALSAVLTQIALYEEAKARNLLPTDEELTAYITHAKTLCEHPDNQECRDVITGRMGMTIDQYFEDSVENYRRGMAIGKLKASVLSSAGVTGGAQVPYWKQFGNETLDDATIEWRDTVLQERFDNQ